MDSNKLNSVSFCDTGADLNWEKGKDVAGGRGEDSSR